ncbi:hypothetical protein [Nocardioides xinjiangensis]|uniref:hypothetical protein n=1 Tax=Nocardioides xinjiangensis TaxID=2817376 RepID=UPI001B3047A6|nr:hypothetical protein [Nocardioides sp. SYSU D00778]
MTAGGKDQAEYRVVFLDPVDDAEPWLGEHITKHGQADAMWRAGFSSDEANDWYAVGRWLVRTEENPEPADVDVAAIAQVWKIAGFTPAETRAWRNAITEHDDPYDVPLTARSWRAAGFTADEAHTWLRPGSVFSDETLEFATLFANQGWYVGESSLLWLLSTRLDIDDLDAYKRAWLDTGIDSVSVLDFIKAGVTPEEAKVLYQLRNREHLESELRAREADLPPIDPSWAAWINHIVYVMCGEEPGFLPFAFEHVRDSHDIANEARQHADWADLYGQPNSEGVYLGRVVEFSADSNEDGWTYADMMVTSAADDVAQRVASDLGYETHQAVIDNSRGGRAVVSFPDGPSVAVIQTTVEAKPWHRETRDPTDEELTRWASLPSPASGS